MQLKIVGFVSPYACGFAAAMIVLVLSSPAAAQTYTWDGQQSGSPSDASGTWINDGTTANWNNGARVVWSNGNDAAFGAGTSGAYIVTLGSNVNPAGISFNTQGYTINPDASNLYSLTVGSDGITANASATINAPVVLGATETWTTASGQQLTVGGNISGSGSLTLAGGNLTLTGSNSYTGTTTNLNGSLNLASAAGPAVPGNVTMGNGTNSTIPYMFTTQNNQFGAGTVISFVNLSGGWTRFELQGTQQALAGISDAIGAGVIENSETGNNGASQLTLSPPAASNYSFNGIFRNGSGTIGLAFNGPGAQTLIGGSISYTGSTSVSGGTLTLQNTGNFNSSQAAVNGNGTLIFSGAGNLSTAFTVSGNGTLNFGNLNSLSGSLTVNANGTATFGNINTLSNAVTVNASGALVFAGNSAVAVPGLNGSGGTLSLTGGNNLILTLAGSNTYSGTTAITNGLLYLSSTTASPISGNVIFGSGVNSTSPGVRTTQDNQFGAGTVMSFINLPGGWSRFELQGTQQALAGISDSLAGGIVENSESGVGGASLLTLSPAATASYSFAGYVRNGTSGTIGLAFNGPGAQTLNGNAISYTGPTTVSGGTLTLQNAGNFDSSSLTVNGGLLVFAGNYNLTVSELSGSGGTISNTGGPLSLTVNQSLSTTFGGVLQNSAGGAISLTKSGAGLLALSGANAYSGGTTVSGGTLQLGNASALGAAAGLTINAGVLDLASFSPTVASLSGAAAGAITNSGSADATLTVNQGGTTTFAGVLSDGATNKLALSLTGGGNGGNLTLSGSNSYSGTTAVANGALYLASAAGTAVPGNVTFGNGTNSTSPYIFTTQNNQFGAGTVISFINAFGGWTRFELQGTQQALAGLSDAIGAGVVENSESGVGGASLLTLSPAATASYSFAGYLRNGGTGTIGLAFNGPGAQTLSGGNIQYTGPTTVSGGTLTLQNLNGSFNTSAITINAGMLFFAAGANVTVPSLNGSGGSMWWTTNNNLTLSGSGGYSGATNITNGALYLSSAGGSAISGNITLGSGADNMYPGVFTTQDNQFGAGTVISFANIRDSNGNGWTRLQLQGTQQTLAGISDANGAGIVEDSESGKGGGTSQLTLAPAATASYSFAGLIRDGDASGTFGLAFNGPGAQTLLGGNINYTGPTTVSGGSLTLQDTTNFNGSEITVSPGGTLDLVRSAAGFGSRAQLTGLITGAGTINVNNAGSGASGGWATFGNGFGLSNFTGTVNVNSGGLSMDGVSGLWSGNPSLNVVSGGVFGLRGQSIAVSALTGNGDVCNDWGGNTCTLIVGSGSFSGIIHGNGSGSGDGTLEQGVLSLSKTGAGILVLSGANTYSGATTVGGGTLQIGNGGTGEALASPTVSISSGATLAFSHADALEYAGAISGSGQVSVGGGGMLILSGNNTYSGATTVNAGTLQVGNGGSGEGLTSSVAMSNNATAAFNHNDPLSYGGAISGSGQLIKLGTGVLDLSGTSSYSGPTTISAGTVELDGNGNNLPLATALTIAAGGVLDLAGVPQTVGSLSGSPGAIIMNHYSPAYASTLTVAPSSGSTTFAGNITSSVALALSGSGQLTLSGTNAYSGGTTVSGGTLDIAAPSALSGSGLVTIAAGGRLVLGSGAGIGSLLAASSPASSGEVALSAAAAPATLGGYEGASGNMATLGDAPALPSGGAGIAVGGTAAAVPEPGTVVLLIVAAVCCLALWRARPWRFRAA